MKTDRHSRIIELVSERNIETQEELAEILNREGFKVTQATVSRDIRQLKLVKITLKNGKQKYALNNNHAEEAYSEKCIRILKEAYVSMDFVAGYIGCWHGLNPFRKNEEPQCRDIDNARFRASKIEII